MSWSSQDIPDLTDKNCIITGSNSGIGYNTALELGRKNATVILACRNKAKADTAIGLLKSEVPNGKFKFEFLDLGDLRSVKDFAHRITNDFKKIDILINNAGIFGGASKATTKDGFEFHMGINHFGHFALTAYLMPSLQKSQSPRIVVVTCAETGMVNLEDLEFKKTLYMPTTAYGASKLANLLFTFELNRRLQAVSSKIGVYAVQPPFTSTNLQTSSPDFISSWFMKGLNVFAQPIEKGAQCSLYAATASGLKSGSLYGLGGFLGIGSPEEVPPPAAALDKTVAKKFFEVSELRTNIQFLIK
eukprot:NODE_900_length_3262_cov_0.670250.p2 type:complete len:303 gc:universal NODE_900_length_3262_cov_0.670250:679-1587(+)